MLKEKNKTKKCLYISGRIKDTFIYFHLFQFHLPYKNPRRKLNPKYKFAITKISNVLRKLNL